MKVLKDRLESDDETGIMLEGGVMKLFRGAQIFIDMDAA
jgi:hypothetical protein